MKWLLISLIVTCTLYISNGSNNNEDVHHDIIDVNDSMQDAFDNFHEADKDKDDQLSKEEFTKWYIKEDQSDHVIDHKHNLVSYGFWPSLGNSFAMILVTELGDKTFFVAAVMAMRYSRIVVFTGAIMALAIMTILSAVIGFALPNLLSPVYTFYAAAALFMFFGSRLLREAYLMYQSGSTGPSEELEETEAELRKKEDENESKDPESGETISLTPQNIKILTSAFSITFLAEWGDRSQIATIALAAAKDPIGVTIGGIIGHALCTGLAVMGGKMLAERISERQVALAGGILFWVFALHSLYTGPENH